jgi:hypothetical protein
MSDEPFGAYGSTRQRRANVSHAEIERAALDVLASGHRPSVQILRKRLGRGSPATIARSLKRFWRDLGTRAQGDPAALTRLPSEIADLADGIWQRALALAGQAAKHEDNAARERLNQIRIENELRAQSFALREKEFETSARERERALSDAREHVAAMMKLLESDRAQLRAKEVRIGDLEAQLEAYRQQLAKIVTHAVARSRAVAQPKVHSVVRSKKKVAAKRRATPSKAKRGASHKRRLKR